MSKRWFLGSIALLGVAVIRASGGRYLETKSGFCNSCHEMNRPYDGWRSSGAERSHQNCIICHSGPGISGVLEAELRGAGQIIAHFALKKDELKGPFIAKVPNYFCTQCHNLSLPRTAKGHLPYQIDGKACSECHRHRQGWDFSGEVRPGSQL